MDDGESCFRVGLGEQVATLGQLDEPWPYRLVVRLAGPRGAEADLFDRATRRNHRITAENRVALLYLLVTKVLEDRVAGRTGEDAGWCHDGELEGGIWGKGQLSLSTMPVLLHRLRGEIDKAGFDSGFLEKGRRVLRLRLVDVVLE